MSTTTTAVERYRPVMSEVEQTTLLGFLAGYRGYTRDAYTLDLRQFTSWCWQRQHRLFEVRRVDIECLARELEDRGKARATVARRLCTIVGFYRYAEEEGVIGTPRPCTSADHASTTSPTSPTSIATSWVRSSSPPARDHALVSLLALNGLRVSEAIGANIEALGLERGHRTLTVLRKGGKLVTMPLAPRVARAVDLAVGERVEGPIFLGSNRERLDRHAAGRIVHRVARRAGIGKRVGPHTLRHAFITAALDAGVAVARRPGSSQPRRPAHDDATMTADANRWIGTPPTSSPPSSPAPPADNQHSGVRCVYGHEPDAGTR